MTDILDQPLHSHTAWVENKILDKPVEKKNPIRLSIIICTLSEREEIFESLLERLIQQIDQSDLVRGDEYSEWVFNAKQGIELLWDTDPVKTIGQKRNDLVDRATGDYIAFIDDDDSVPEYYIDEILRAIESGPDVVGIQGVVDFDGKNPRPFKHSIQYNGWYSKDGVYYRTPNHWNPVRRELALSTRFPSVNYGEDWNYSVKLRPKLKTEVFIERDMYFYHHSTSGSIAERRQKEDLRSGKVKQSQNGEDKIVMDFFKGHIGTFLDIGAYDGETMSNTFALAQNGWSGVCVEPSAVFGKLAELYKDRQDIELLQVAVGEDDGMAVLYDCLGDMSSTLNQREAKKWENKGLKFVEHDVEVLSVDTLLGRCKIKTFDFINIDVEDDDLGLRILQQFDMIAVGCRLVCIEGSFRTKEQAFNWLWQYGFKIAAETPENLLLVRENV